MGDKVALTVVVGSAALKFGRIKPGLMERRFSCLGVTARPSDVPGRVSGWRVALIEVFGFWPNRMLSGRTPSS